MKNFYIILIICCFTFLNSCSPKIKSSITSSYAPLDYKEEVIVIAIDKITPDNAENLGKVEIKDTGFTTNCSYDVIIDKAKLEARKAGGNAIKIIEHKTPSVLGSSCHRITANILKIKNIENYDAIIEEELMDVDYAILNVYRYGGVGSLISFDLYLGDSVICRVKNNFKTSIKIKKDGLNSLWAKTESKSEVPINLKFGKSYYVRCGVKMGILVGKPKLEMVDYKMGKIEFESFNAKNK